MLLFAVCTNFIVMHHVLEAHIRKRLGDNTTHLDLVMEHFKPLSIKRNELLVTEGEICRNVYFIASGCLQVFVRDENGEEKTRDIVTEDNWCSELISFGGQKPATENIRTIEQAQLLAIDFAGFGKMMAQVPQFDVVYRQILEQSYANSVYRINTFVALSALERMKWLMEHRPALMTRVPAKIIASYLGINKDVFSRLRSQL